MIKQKTINNNMAEKKKSAPKKVLKRVNKKTISPEIDNVNSSEHFKLENGEQIEDLIKQAFIRFYNTSYTNKSKEKELDHLNNIMEEYLQSYMVLGYDLNGEKICIMNAHNSSQKDALIEHLRSTLVGILNQ
jgi:hypothetical protein